MSKSAPEQELQTLHALVAKLLREDLKDDERRSPQLLSQAIKFLKDNGIEPARDTDNAALKALSEQIDAITRGDAEDTDGLLN